MQSNIIGNKIKDLRIKRKITQQKLSDDLSVASSTISNWEKGRRLPSISDLKRIAKYFEVSLGCFDLEVEAYDQNATLNGNMLHQVIDTRPIGHVTKRSDWVFFMIAIGFLTIGMILSNPDIKLFFTSIPIGIIYGFYVFGVAMFLYVLLVTYNRHRVVNKNNYKRIMLPSEYHVFYMYERNDMVSNRKKRGIGQRSRIVTLMSVLFYAFALFLLYNTDMLLVQILLSLYALFAITMSWLRHKAIKSSKISEDRIDYYEIRQDMSYSSIYHSMISDVFGLYLVCGIVLFFFEGLPYSFVSSMVLALAFIHMILSYGVYCDFNSLIAQYDLYACDEQGNTIRID